MPNSEIFCSVPWHSSHLYWDGTYGACCEEMTKPIGPIGNIRDITLNDWYNSSTMQHFRKRILGDKKLPECKNCYNREAAGHESKRIRENFKVAIFTKQAFEKSFQESKWNNEFINSLSSNGKTDSLPRDLHIDFGNECNLACKMCGPNASSRIAHHYNSWQIKYDKNDNWSDSDDLYEKLLDNIKNLNKIHRIHIMGGEPTVNKRFYKFIDWLLQNNYDSISLSFVSNGTSIDKSFLNKLKKFRTVDVEISLESIKDNNHYIRQGSVTKQILNNIYKLLEFRSPTFNIVLRSVPQLLNINNYYEYIWFAYSNRLSIQSLPLVTPSFLAVNVLPKDIRSKFITNYELIKKNILKNHNVGASLATGRDTSRLEQQLINECDMVINLLLADNPHNQIELQQELIQWLVRWDKIYNLNALDFYPEYSNFLIKHGYNI
jgi:sulfatase maturation enzyme AslB (radical SAM superfamily)